MWLLSVLYAVYVFECNAIKAFATLSYPNIPLIICFILTVITPPFKALLAGGIDGSSKKLKI